MRSALLCVFFAFVIHKEGKQSAADDGFQPMPIPLTEWHYDRRVGRVGTLHEAVNTASPPFVAAVPAHYWEDALRHSVYLTLVRDKIDQLIAKGTLISPNNSPHGHNSKEVDDHDLWDKIKNAPFDRIKDDSHTSFGDVTIMAKGRLLEQNEGSFRFTEDEKTKEKCDDASCAQGVKAFWSVKRIRQRDEEPSTGKYHYELTFSVMSQAPKKQIKPYENPVRTFTVRENQPEVVDKPYQVHPIYEPIQTQVTSARPHRAIWFHKNLPNQSVQGRRYHQSLDRIFSSFFSDEEPEPPRYRPNVWKQANNGPSNEPQYQQKKLVPYPYKPPTHKYVRPPLPAPPYTNIPHLYSEHEPLVANSFAPQPIDHRYVAPSNVIKTTRPAVLPTPPDPYFVTNTKNIGYNRTDNYTKEPEITTYKIYSKLKPSPVKVSYFPDHLRPPVYNAPPGVFVTMDKKPFKPMPPLKLAHPVRPTKNRPIDFRPSPQLDNTEFSLPSDSALDTAFKPIMMNFHDTTNKTGISINTKKGDKHFRKPSIHGKKTQKKHENIKSHKLSTTSAPDIITAVHVDFDKNDPPEWANVVGAFTRTTPMEPQKQIVESSESSENIEHSSSTTIATTTKKKRVTPKTLTTEPTTSTTPKPIRRTRPPPKFTKPIKVKKHKRITTTTKTPPKTQEKAPIEDLTPQASSAATKPNKNWEQRNNTNTTISMNDISIFNSSNTEPSTTTEQLKATITTTTQLPKTTTIEATIKTAQPKNNRFRQSTLMHKGTSVNHDKWSVTAEKNKTLLPVSGKFNSRRKGSNFQGHITTRKPITDIDHKGEDHTDTHKSKMNALLISSTSTQPTYEETADQYESNSELPSSDIVYGDEEDDDDGYEKQKTDNGSENISNNKKAENDSKYNFKDEKEYIFSLTSTAANENTNEISDSENYVKEKSVTVATVDTPKNKTKCKKKNQANLTTTKALLNESTISKYDPMTTSTTTTVKVTTEILDDSLDGFTYDDTTEKTDGALTPSISELEEEESEQHEKYVQIDDDFEDFLDKLEKGGHDNQEEELYDDGDNKTSAIENFSPFDNESEDESLRQRDNDEYDEYSDRSLSFLELMAME